MPSYINDERFTPIDLSTFKLADFKTDFTVDYHKEDEATEERTENTAEIAKLQEKLYAEGKKGLLMIFQAMDAAGKDSTIKHIMSGVNPQGCKVTSFKQPSKKELSHDFLWRCHAAIPERGHIGIFNRSYYEEVLVCKVHPEYVLGQGIGNINALEQLDENFWIQRYESIKNAEKHWSNNGYKVIKFFLNVGKEEQKARFLRRIALERKNWKFSYGDVQERALWDKYMAAYEAMIKATHTQESPWFIIPADQKWFMQYAVSEITKDILKDLDPKYPDIDEKEKEGLQKAERELKAEK